MTTLGSALMIALPAPFIANGSRGFGQVGSAVRVVPVRLPVGVLATCISGLGIVGLRKQERMQLCE